MNISSTVRSIKLSRLFDKINEVLLVDDAITRKHVKLSVVQDILGNPTGELWITTAPKTTGNLVEKDDGFLYYKYNFTREFDVPDYTRWLNWPSSNRVNTISIETEVRVMSVQAFWDLVKDIFFTNNSVVIVTR